jgi:hypothetical protein
MEKTILINRKTPKCDLENIKLLVYNWTIWNSALAYVFDQKLHWSCLSIKK